VTLQTAESINLERITIHSPDFFKRSGYREWQDLDRLLLQFWISHSIRPKIGCRNGDRYALKSYASRLLPELTSRGVVDLVECE